MKIVGVFEKGYGSERWNTIGAVTGVVFGQLFTQQQVLESGENLVAGILIQRHPTLESISMDHHARAENRVRLPIYQGFEQIIHYFRRVLTIAMKQYHDVKVVLEGIKVT